MPTFDDSIFALIQAGDIAGAQEALDTGHPTAFVDTIGSTAQFAINSGRSASISSMTIGTGTKNFTNTVPKGWVSGTPVYITDDAAPSTNYMFGTLTADESDTGDCTANVIYAAGSGTYTAWTIHTIVAVTTVASTPVAVADGGTGNTTEAATRDAFDLIRRFEVKSVVSTPPGSPSSGDSHIVGDAPTGAWASNENDIATWNGSSWDFVTPADGDIAFDENDGFIYLFSSTASTEADALWPNSDWNYISNRPAFAANNPQTSSYTVVESDHGKYIGVSAQLGNRTITLPASGGVRKMEFHIAKTDATANTVTIDLASGTNRINGGTTLVLSSQDECVRLLNDQQVTWFAWKTP